MAKKTAFVNEMLLQSLKQNQQITSPIIKTITKLDDRIKQILDDDNLDEQKKIQLYTQTLQQYRNVRQNLEPAAASLLATPTSTSKESITNNESTKVYADKSIIETVPTTYRTRASNLLRFIKNDDKIKWNDNGIVTYNGRTLNNSNIIDLVNDVVRPRKRSQPNRWQEFAQALDELNVPKDLIGNPRRKTVSHTNFQEQQSSKPLGWETI